METHYGSYYEYSMPTDKFTAYYDSIIPPIFRQPLRLIKQKFVPLRKILKSQWAK